MLSGIRKVLLTQLLVVLLASAGFLVFSGRSQALAAGFGGMISLLNVMLLEWRRKQADRGPALTAGQSLRVLYRSAVERFVLVALLFAAGIGALALYPLALLTGFIAGQLALLLTGMERTD
ncbi:MAG: ATP synthase subunit I [Gammaproteobacteria bacterium]